ncbi:hypothetical protein EDD99_5702 [Streptomyces sp. 846.5]|nr:hypothetical protein [Streptomyces sp. 846.5]TDT97552.1 hypothetical protein EDD99_5702 [Streptomyces sp. 846.5]
MTQHPSPVAVSRSSVPMRVLAGCAVAATLLLAGAHAAPAGTAHSAGQTVTAAAVGPDEWNSGGA